MKSLAVSGRLLLVSILVGVNGWLAMALVEPLAPSATLQYVLAFRPLVALLIWVVPSVLALSFLQRVLARRGATVPVGPMTLLALPIVALFWLATPLRRYAGPWLFLFVDLRWWLFAGVLLLEGLAIDSALAHRPTRRLREWCSNVAARTSSRFWLELALAATLMVTSIATSPVDRFQSSLIGDEPKYMRFLENWYRGQGLDISAFPPISQLPIDEPPRLGGNLTRIGAAIVEIARDVSNDGRRLVGLSAPARPGRPTSEGGWFVTGKRGGLYQVHNPGVSVLLFPGYVIDRYLLNWTSDVLPQFPTYLYVTNATQLAIYLLWGIALFRLLSTHTGNRGTAWLLAAIAMTSLPATAFAYQYYPEAAAGLALTLLVLYVMRDALTSPRTALLYGFLAGYLPWLHPRFGLAAIIFVLAVWFHRSRPIRVFAAFAAGFAIPLAALAGYDYHISGSPFPWALYAGVPDSPGFSVPRALHDLPRVWFDNQRGLIAYAPIYLAALPGLLLLWRRGRSLAVIVLSIVGAVALLSAAHEWGGGDSTPLRLVAAVTPLLMLPAAEAWLACRPSRWFVAAFALLAIVSVQNGLTYNLHLVKASQYMMLSVPSVSGWQTPLLLPSTAGAAYWLTPLFAAWALISIALIGAPAWLLRDRRATVEKRDSGPESWTAVAAVVSIAFAVTGSVISAHTGVTFDEHFLPASNVVRDELLVAYLDGKAGPTLSTGSTRTHSLDLAALYANPRAASIVVRPAATPRQVDEPTLIDLDARGTDGQIAWGHATIDFGDTSPRSEVAMVGRLAVAHTYRTTGDFRVSVDLSGPGPLRLTATDVAHVDGPPVAPSVDVGRPIPGLPADLIVRPAAIAIDTLVISESRVDVQCTLPSPLSGAENSDLWIWLITTQQGARRATLYNPQRSADAKDSRRVSLGFAPNPRPADDDLIGVVVGMRPGSKGAMVRSDVVPVRWPSTSLTMGAAIELKPADAWR